jgi:signal transduction histidine kinase
VILDEETYRRIFQGFFSTKGTDGTGIGLMMTQKIVDQHDGIIEVDSRAGCGATFTVLLVVRIRNPWATVTYWMDNM